MHPCLAVVGSDVAHVLHFGIVFAGLAGLALVLAPAHLERWSAGASLPHDEHAVRTMALRGRALAGTLAQPAGPSAEPDGTPVPGHRQPARPRLVAAPVVVVASLAAAGAHLAVAPLHLRGPDAGVMAAGFLLTVGLVQMAWAIRVASGARRVDLTVGLVGNLAVLGVWLLSRTVGLPRREPAGPWDLACAAWEVVIVAGCAWMLHRRQLPALRRCGARWHPVAAGWLAFSSVLLGILSISGAPA